MIILCFRARSPYLSRSMRATFEIRIGNLQKYKDEYKESYSANSNRVEYDSVALKCKPKPNFGPKC